MATIAEKLTKIKKEIDDAKLEKAEIEGALKQNMQRLKNEFQVRSVEAAKTKLEELKKEKDKLDGQIEKAMKRLEATYEW